MTRTSSGDGGRGGALIPISFFLVWSSPLVEQGVEKIPPVIKNLSLTAGPVDLSSPTKA